MRDEKARSTEDSLENRRPVQAFDAASAAQRLREEKTYEDHGRSVLSLFREPSLRAMLTAIAAGRLGGQNADVDDVQFGPGLGSQGGGSGGGELRLL